MSRSTSQRTNQPSDQPLVQLAFQQGGQTTSKINDAVQVKARHAIDKVQKELSEKAVRHITTAKMMYKPINDDINVSNIRSTGCKPKSWELDYPALAFLMNGRYYVDYASICRLCVSFSLSILLCVYACAYMCTCSVVQCI